MFVDSNESAELFNTLHRIRNKKKKKKKGPEKTRDHFVKCIAKVSVQSTLGKSGVHIPSASTKAHIEKERVKGSKRRGERRYTQGLFPFQILIEKITNVTNKYPILLEKEEDFSAGKGVKKEKKKVKSYAYIDCDEIFKYKGGGKDGAEPWAL